MDWYGVKEAIEEFTGLHMDALHVHVGVLAQIAVALLTRRSLASPLPWLVVLAAALANEWFDLSWSIWPDREWQYEESVRDVWNTMLLPTVLLALAQVWPGMPGRTKPAAAPAPETEAGD